MRACSCASSPAGCSPTTVLRRVATKPTTTKGTTTTAKMTHGITRAAYPPTPCRSRAETVEGEEVRRPVVRDHAVEARGRIPMGRDTLEVVEALGGRRGGTRRSD